MYAVIEAPAQPTHSHKREADDEGLSILKVDVEKAVRSMNAGNFPVVDNVTPGLIKKRMRGNDCTRGGTNPEDLEEEKED
ncbi:hypothetical protein DPMN_174772 [Dreissena polymorpha]|uniref:Uncharacterized protein n=1 Tax=Dreissena polymorpha TaxID=45954 RepID=A0A9D4E3Z6_DREPO|nr:hypothetical protein DPMN_174772 [Dreissena polymorpha]